MTISTFFGKFSRKHCREETAKKTLTHHKVYLTSGSYSASASCQPRCLQEVILSENLNFSTFSAKTPLISFWFFFNFVGHQKGWFWTDYTIIGIHRTQMVLILVKFDDFPPIFLAFSVYFRSAKNFRTPKIWDMVNDNRAVQFFNKLERSEIYRYKVKKRRRRVTNQ